MTDDDLKAIREANEKRRELTILQPPSSGQIPFVIAAAHLRRAAETIDALLAEVERLKKYANGLSHQLSRIGWGEPW